MRVSSRLMADTGDLWDVTGPSVKTSSWYGYSSKLHTISFRVHELKGRIILEASLSEKPQENDWFPIQLGVDPWIQYPIDPLNPNAPNGGDTRIDYVTFKGNFAYIRAKLSRQHISTTPLPGNYGKVVEILLG